MHRSLLLSQSVEWFTPPWVIEHARLLIGGALFDLDPASNCHAQAYIQAKEWYGLDHPLPDHRDGLRVSWYGNVWLNPPYGRGILRWIQKAVDEYRAGRATRIVCLVPARLDTRWFRLLHTTMRGMYVYRSRLVFLSPTGTTSTAPFPSVLVVVGDCELLPLPNTDRYVPFNSC